MNLFNSILKHKKTIFIVFFSIILLSATPQIAKAADWIDKIGAWNPFASAGKLWCLTPWDSACDFGQKNAKAAAANGVLIENLIPDIMTEAVAAVALAIGIVIVIITGTVGQLAASLLNWVIGLDVGCYTCMANPIIANGWTMVRDLANMGIVLGFVVIGLATTLRIGDYEAKKLLPKLIIAALLINFSLLICGLFIDAAKITATYFNQSGGFFATSWAQTQTDQISTVYGAWKNNSAKDAVYKVLMAAGGLLFYNIMATVIFFLYFFLYMFRHMALWILVILSPLAFVCYVFPFTKKFFQMWWSNFFQWCIILVPISFFVWLADGITSSMKRNTATVPALGYIIPGCFMVIGFLYSLKMSAMGAGAATGAFKWAGGKVTGAVSGGGGNLLNKITGGRSGAATEKVSAAAGKAMERLGLRQTGTTDTAVGKKVDEKAKLTSTAYIAAKARGDTATTDRIRRTALSGRGSDRAAAIKTIAEAGDMHEAFDGNLGRMNDAIKYAESSGAKGSGGKGLREEIAKSDPRLAGDATKIREAVQKMSPSDFAKNVKANAITPQVFAAMTEDQISFVMNDKKESSQDKKEAIKGLVAGGPTGTQYSEDMQKYLKGVQQSDAIAIAPKIAIVQSSGTVKSGTPSLEAAVVKQQKERLRNPSGESYGLQGDKVKAAENIVGPSTEESDIKQRLNVAAKAGMDVTQRGRPKTTPPPLPETGKTASTGKADRGRQQEAAEEAVKTSGDQSKIQEEIDKIKKG